MGGIEGNLGVSSNDGYNFFKKLPYTYIHISF